MKKYLIVSILIIGAIVVYIIFQRNSKKQYLIDWANTDTGTSRELRLAAINKMTASELDGLYRIVRDYFNSPTWKEGATLPPDLQTLWTTFHTKYGPPF